MCPLLMRLHFHRKSPCAWYYGYLILFYAVVWMLFTSCSVAVTNTMIATLEREEFIWSSMSRSQSTITGGSQDGKLQAGLLAIPHSITSDQGTHSQSRKTAGAMEECFSMPSSWAYA